MTSSLYSNPNSHHYSEYFIFVFIKLFPHVLEIREQRKLHTNQKLLKLNLCKYNTRTDFQDILEICFLGMLFGFQTFFYISNII